MDVATGEMLLPQTVLGLPGVLQLVLGRTHPCSAADRRQPRRRRELIRFASAVHLRRRWTRHLLDRLQRRHLPYVYDQAGRVVRTEGPDGILSSSCAYGEPEPDTGPRTTRKGGR
ncbi:hypothetical protein P376_1789 [Streptomyces sp. HCCB10043]|nr:hypothetical protein [Streptomyces filamentosus]ESU50229.1 hypothetical protein P376_1789 [Streptomyces sp. HCCB10043]